MGAELHDAFRQNILVRFPAAQKAASKNAITVLESIVRVHFMTFRAICRRDGVFTSGKGVKYDVTKDMYVTLAIAKPIFRLTYAQVQAGH